MYCRYPIPSIGKRNQAPIAPAKKPLHFLSVPIIATLVVGFFMSGILCGCAVSKKVLTIQGYPQEFEAGTIISTRTGLPVTFEALIDDLNSVRIIYVGENHTNAYHHQIQLNIIQSLADRGTDLAVGVEMIDRSYQPVLDEWSSGCLATDELIKRTHWYSNWRYPFKLYADIFEFIKSKKIRLIALNLPFHIPPKIRIGGISSVLGCDSNYLPEHLDTSVSAHRAYIEEVFKQHHGRVKTNFEYFYEAQCAWEDGMAEAIVGHLQEAVMVVLIGNGHIFRKFGVPDRAFKRTRASFRTIYPAPAGAELTSDVADYLWVTP